MYPHRAGVVPCAAGNGLGTEGMDEPTPPIVSANTGVTFQTPARPRPATIAATRFAFRADPKLRPFQSIDMDESSYIMQTNDVSRHQWRLSPSGRPEPFCGQPPVHCHHRQP